MSQVEKVSVALTVELAEEVREAVRQGQYASSSEVIREALRQWSLRRAGQARIRELWDEGVASGIAKTYRTAAQISADGRRRLAKLKAAE